MRLELVQNLATLQSYSDAWSELNLPSPMQSPDWLLSWWEAYGKDNAALSLCVLTVWEEDQLVGIAPFYTIDHPLLGKTLRWLGDGRASTDHMTILTASAEHEPTVVAAVAKWIIEGASENWNRLRLEAVDVDDRATNHLERLLTEANLDTEWVDDIGSFPAPLGENWEEYLASFSRNRRKKILRWNREWFDTGRATVQIATTEEERQAMWPLLISLHNDRREGMGEEGAFNCPRFNRFHELASARLLAKGQLYLGMLLIDGVPAAIDYAPQDADAIYVYQGGISEEGLKNDAGHLCAVAQVKNAIEAGRTRFDLLRGDEPYKKNWQAEHLGARVLHARPRTLSGTIERWAGNAYRSIRDARVVAHD